MPNDPPTLADRTKEFYKHGNGGEFSKGEELNGRSAKMAKQLGLFTVPTMNALPVNNKNDPYTKFVAPDDRHRDTKILAKGQEQDRFKRVSVPKKGKSNLSGPTTFEGKHIWLQKVGSGTTR